MPRNLHFVRQDASRDEVAEMAKKALGSYQMSGSKESLKKAGELVKRLEKMEEIDKREAV